MCCYVATHLRTLEKKNQSRKGYGMGIVQDDVPGFCTIKKELIWSLKREI